MLSCKIKSRRRRWPLHYFFSPERMQKSSFLFPNNTNPTESRPRVKRPPRQRQNRSKILDFSRIGDISNDAYVTSIANFNEIQDLPRKDIKDTNLQSTYSIKTNNGNRSEPCHNFRQTSAFIQFIFVLSLRGIEVGILSKESREICGDT